MITFVCWKWFGNTVNKNKSYDYRHVNALRNALETHMSKPFELVCITDNDEGIANDVRIIDADKNFGDYTKLGGCYRRLKAFGPAGRMIADRFVHLDLDNIVCGDLAPLDENAPDFKMYGDTHPATEYNGSLWLMDACARREVWDDFEPSKAPNLGFKSPKCGTDQAWISQRLGGMEERFGKKDGVYSFRVDLQGDFIMKGRKKDKGLPRDARLVVCHGAHNPPKMTNLDWVQRHWRP